MDIPIIYDHREWASNIPAILDLQYPEVATEAAQLPLADYLLSDRLAVERKSLNDLQASMEDRRLFAQVQELQEHYPLVVVIVEIGQRHLSNGQQGALAWCLRQGASVLTVKDHEATAAWLVRLAKQEHQPAKRKEGIRRKAVDPDMQLRQMVASSPGIGSNTAESLLRQFGSLVACINASEEQLRSVPGVGKKRATQLYALWNRTYDEQPDA